MRHPVLIHALSFLIASTGLSVAAAAQVTIRASVDSQEAQASGASLDPAVSATGRFVAFCSSARTLVPGDTNGSEDVFVRDRLNGLTSRVSVNSVGMQTRYGGNDPSISDDGRYVAFTSFADDLTELDSNNSIDVFVHDRLTGQTVCASVDATGAAGNLYSFMPRISADGSCVAFLSVATNLVHGDTNGLQDVFVRDLVNGRTSRVNIDSSGLQANRDSAYAAISGDGSRVAFGSYATNLVPSDTNEQFDVFVHDRRTGLTSLCSVSTANVQANRLSEEPSISADGCHVAFLSYANNLVSGDTNGEGDVFVRDLQTGRTERNSVSSEGAQANSVSQSGTFSADGRYVSFTSWANNLVAGDTNSTADCFVRDRLTGQTVRVSVDSSGLQGNGSSSVAVISSDGTWIAFTSNANNLVPQDTNYSTDVFLRSSGFGDPHLTRTGFCMGPMTLTVRGATRGGRVAFACGNAGPFVKAAPPCAGMVLGIIPPAFTAVIRADGLGTAVLAVSSWPQVCGLTVQAVDVESCTPTNAIVL